MARILVAFGTTVDRDLRAILERKWMASRAGRDTDTSRDDVDTDWVDLVTFAARFTHTVDARPVAAAIGHGGL